MNLYEFLELRNYPIRDKEQYKEAFTAFLKDTQLKPFFDAIMRNASSAAIEALKKQILEQGKKIWFAFDSYLPSEERRRIEEWSHVWDELTIEPPRSGARVYTFRASDTALRNIFFFVTHEELAALELEIRRVGRIVLENEHRTAMANLIKSDQKFYSFEEYVAAAWVEASVDSSGHQNPSLYQRLGYLAYLENLVQRFNHAGLLYTENRKQAQALSEEIKKWRQIVVDAIAKLNNLSTELAETKIEYALKSRALERLADRLVNEENSDPELSSRVSATQKKPAIFLTEAEHAEIDRFNRQRKELLETHPDCIHLQSEIDELYRKENAIPRRIEEGVSHFGEIGGQLASGVRRYEEYWRDNLPKFFARAKDIQAMVALTAPAISESDILLRNITEGEYRNLQVLKQFSQAPGCLEREKWFYEPGASPGAGVSHPVRCKIYLRRGGGELLRRLQKPDGHFAAVVKKDAEPRCFGIHEDALPAFNAMVGKVEFFGRANQRLGEITFDRTKSLEALVYFGEYPSIAARPGFLFLGMHSESSAGAIPAAGVHL